MGGIKRPCASTSKQSHRIPAFAGTTGGEGNRSTRSEPAPDLVRERSAILDSFAKGSLIPFVVSLSHHGRNQKALRFHKQAKSLGPGFRRDDGRGRQSVPLGAAPDLVRRANGGRTLKTPAGPNGSGLSRLIFHPS